MFPMYETAANIHASLTRRGAQYAPNNALQFGHAAVTQPVKIPGSGEGVTVMPGLSHVFSQASCEHEMTFLPHVKYTTKPNHSQHASLSESHEDN
jgi:hypothetical protein